MSELKATNASLGAELRFGSVVFSIRNFIIGIRSQTSELSSSVVYTATIAWSVGEPGKSTDTCTCAVPAG